MEQFTKIFNSKKFLQIVCMICTNKEDKPSIRIFFKPKNASVCEITMPWKDRSKKSFENAQEYFNGLNLIKATEIIETSCPGLR